MAISPITSYDIPSEGSWPTCRAPWAFEPTRGALLVHDMQAYFLEAFEPNCSPLRPLLQNVRALRRACGAAGMPVIFSAQPGEQSRDERGLLWDLWGPGIVEKPGLEALALELGAGPNDLLLPKRRYSAFHDTPLLELLRARGRDQLAICGVYAHIGCLATATDGFMSGVQPFVVADATADFSPEDHALALRQVARTCGVVSTTRGILTAVHVPLVRAVLAELLEQPPQAIGLDDDLSDHGLDSIRGAQLIERVLARGHGLTFEDILQARSLRDVATLMARTEEAAHAPA
jgi:bifunctional isochorismate lyase / aryl carrier protein